MRHFKAAHFCGAHLVMFTLAIFVARGRADDPQTEKGPPRFEVASIHLGDPNQPSGKLGFFPGGKFVAENYPLRTVMLQTSHIDDLQLLGGPDWLTKEKFSIQANAPGGPFSDAEMRRLCWRLYWQIAFKFRYHRETKGNNELYSGCGQEGTESPARKRQRKGDARTDGGWLAVP